VRDAFRESGELIFADVQVAKLGELSGRCGQGTEPVVVEIEEVAQIFEFSDAFRDLGELIVAEVKGS